MVGRAAHSRACLGPTLVSTVLSPLLSEFRDFRDRILSYRGVSPPHLFSCIPFCATCGDKHISKRNSEHILRGIF